MNSISEYLDPADGPIKGRAKGLFVGLTIAVLGPVLIGMLILVFVMVLPAIVVWPPLAGLIAPRRLALFFRKAREGRDHG